MNTRTSGSINTSGKSPLSSCMFLGIRLVRAKTFSVSYHAIFNCHLCCSSSSPIFYRGGASGRPNDSSEISRHLFGHLLFWEARLREIRFSIGEKWLLDLLYIPKGRVQCGGWPRWTELETSLYGWDVLNKGWRPRYIFHWSFLLPLDIFQALPKMVPRYLNGIEKGLRFDAMFWNLDESLSNFPTECSK